LVGALGPDCFLTLHATCRQLSDLAAAPIAKWYWQQLLLHALPGTASTISLGGHHSDESDARQWRQAFLDLDGALLGARLLSTTKDYTGFHSSRTKPPRPPPNILFDSPLHCRLDPACPLGGDRMVIGSAPLPELLSCTPVRSKDGWSLAHRPVQGYFELTFGSKSDVRNGVGADFDRWRQACVSIGLCAPELDPSTPSRRQVGWCKHSWGLHGDDGQLYHARGFGVPFHALTLGDPARRTRERGAPQSVCFGAGDTVGCGVVVLPVAGGFLRGIFFTVNGDFLGIGFRLEASVSRLLHPCFGIDAHWPIVVNFGAQPFSFDVDELGHLCAPPRYTSIPTSPTSRRYFPSFAEGACKPVPVQEDAGDAGRWEWIRARVEAVPRLSALRSASSSMLYKLRDAVLWARSRSPVRPLYD